MFKAITYDISFDCNSPWNHKELNIKSGSLIVFWMCSFLSPQNTKKNSPLHLKKNERSNKCIIRSKSPSTLLNMKEHNMCGCCWMYIFAIYKQKIRRRRRGGRMFMPLTFYANEHIANMATIQNYFVIIISMNHQVLV